MKKAASKETACNGIGTLFEVGPRKEAKMKAVVLMLALSLAPSMAHSEEWDASVRRLCVSTKQMDCWVKAGAAICDKDQVTCKDLPDHAPAKIIRKVGKRWLVETPFGKGYVSERMMMIDSSK